MSDENSVSQSQQMNPKSSPKSMLTLERGSMSSPHEGQAWKQSLGTIFRRKSTMSWGVPSSSNNSWSRAASSPRVSSWSRILDFCSSFDSSSKLFSSLTISSIVFPRRFMTTFWLRNCSTLASLRRSRCSCNSSKISFCWRLNRCSSILPIGFFSGPDRTLDR